MRLPVIGEALEDTIKGAFLRYYLKRSLLYHFSNYHIVDVVFLAWHVQLLLFGLETETSLLGAIMDAPIPTIVDIKLHLSLLHIFCSVHSIKHLKP